MSSIKNTNKTLNLLYVEDDVTAHKVTELGLQNFFNKVFTAVDGVEGLTIFKNSEIDLLITNLNLSKLSGMDMIKEIRSIDSNIPIIILSEYQDTKYLMESIKSGVQDYILKPVKSHELANSIKNIIKIIEKRKLEYSVTSLLQHYKDIADRSSIISKTDCNGIITYVNEKFCKVTGYRLDELIGEEYIISRRSNESKDTFKKLLKTVSTKRAVWQGVIKNITKERTTYYAKATIQPILNDKGKIEEFMISQTVITDIIHPKQQLLDFLEPLDESIVVLIKIDDFKYFQAYVDDDLSEASQKVFADELFSRLPTDCGFSKIYFLGDGEFALAKRIKEFNEDVESLVVQMRQYKIRVNRT